jgi:aarF domain-containing kinase
VPSFDDKLAMATIERELGRPVDELFSELSPSPVGASTGHTTPWARLIPIA